MLSAARAALVELGVLAPTDPLPPFWARMSGNLLLTVYPDTRSFFLVKIGIRTNLDREFRGLSAGYAAMPRHVPRALGLTTREAHEVLVTEGVSHQPLVSARRREWFAIFERDMGAFLSAGARHFRAASSDSALDVHEALRETAAAIGWSGWKGYWDRVESLVARLPRIPQHGDLAVNNIAIADGRLVFFDWEDFGLVDLAGFDLAVVLLSLHNFNVASLRANLAAPTMQARLVKQCCTQLAIAPGQFPDLLPAYLSLFINIKRSGGYDTAVPERAAAALREWIHALA
jgi:hypothetical protein